MVNLIAEVLSVEAENMDCRYVARVRVPTPDPMVDTVAMVQAAHVAIRATYDNVSFSGWQGPVSTCVLTLWFWSTGRKVVKL